MFLILEAVALWRLLYFVTDWLRDPRETRSGLSFHLDQPRHLAIWAGAALFVLVPLSALYGPWLIRYAGHLFTPA